MNIFSRSTATKLLKSGIEKGLISKQERNGYPQNVWAVTADRQPLEAQLENAESGTYHGYPVLKWDPLYEIILERWNRS